MRLHAGISLHHGLFFLYRAAVIHLSVCACMDSPHYIAHGETGMTFSYPVFSVCQRVGLIGRRAELCGLSRGLNITCDSKDKRYMFVF